MNEPDRYKITMHKMMHIGRLHRGVVERKIADLGIHQSQHRVLMYIANVGEVASQKQIAEMFGVTPSAIARSLKSLESEGYIVRESTPDDSRYNRIIITQKGKDIVERSKEMFREADEQAFGDLSDEDMDEFNRYLDAIKAKLTSDCCGC